MIFNIKTILQFAIIALFLHGCTHSHEDGHIHDNGHDNGHDHKDEHAHENGDAHDDNNEHEDEGPHKTVHLNEAQYSNTNIELGWFAMKNLSDVIHANGYTKLDPQDQAEVSMPVSGTVKTIKIIEGNFVKKGQTLGTMVSLELSAMQMTKAKLEEELATSESHRSFLQKEFDRQTILALNNINAKKVLEKVNADLESEIAKILSIKNQLEISVQTLNLVGGGESSSYIPIIAPISGHITHVNVKIGVSVNSGESMFSIVDNSQMHVDMLVYEKDLDKVKVGQKVRFILTNQSNKEIKGKIYNIGKSFANETKSVAVHADIEENDANLIPGMYINALIDIGNNKVKAVPNGAVVMAEGREFIFLLEREDQNESSDPDDEEEFHFERLEVKTGARQLGFVEVTPLNEIHEGDKIVLNGAYYLQSHLQKAEGGGGHSH